MNECLAVYRRFQSLYLLQLTLLVRKELLCLLPCFCLYIFQDSGIWKHNSPKEKKPAELLLWTCVFVLPLLQVMQLNTNIICTTQKLKQLPESDTLLRKSPGTSENTHVPHTFSPGSSQRCVSQSPGPPLVTICPHQRTIKPNEIWLVTHRWGGAGHGQCERWVPACPQAREKRHAQTGVWENTTAFC